MKDKLYINVCLCPGFTSALIWSLTIFLMSLCFISPCLFLKLIVLLKVTLYSLVGIFPLILSTSISNLQIESYLKLLSGKEIVKIISPSSNNFHFFIF